MNAKPATNVELVRAAIGAYNDRDAAALSRLMRPDVDLRPPIHALQGRAYRGHDGVRQWLRDVEESFAEARIESVDLRDLGPTVVALTSFRVRGKESRLELESELGLILEISGGQIASWHGFFSHSDALAAVGVEPE
jgi:ketosteroid isomerase-like protein